MFEIDVQLAKLHVTHLAAFGQIRVKFCANDTHGFLFLWVYVEEDNMLHWHRPTQDRRGIRCMKPPSLWDTMRSMNRQSGRLAAKQMWSQSQGRHHHWQTGGCKQRTKRAWDHCCVIEKRDILLLWRKWTIAVGWDLHSLLLLAALIHSLDYLTFDCHLNYSPDHSVLTRDSSFSIHMLAAAGDVCQISPSGLF